METAEGVQVATLWVGVPPGISRRVFTQALACCVNGVVDCARILEDYLPDDDDAFRTDATAAQVRFTWDPTPGGLSILPIETVRQITHAKAGLVGRYRLPMWFSGYKAGLTP